MEAVVIFGLMGWAARGEFVPLIEIVVDKQCRYSVCLQRC
jgi:hypothetical protein